MCAPKRSTWQRIKDFFTGSKPAKAASEIDDVGSDFVEDYLKKNPGLADDIADVSYDMSGPRGVVRGGNRPIGKAGKGQNMSPDSLWRRRRGW